MLWLVSLLICCEAQRDLLVLEIIGLTSVQSVGSYTQVNYLRGNSVLGLISRIGAIYSVFGAVCVRFLFLAAR